MCDGFGVVWATVRAHDEGQAAGPTSVRGRKDKNSGKLGGGELEEEGAGYDGGGGEGGGNLVVGDDTAFALVDEDAETCFA